MSGVNRTLPPPPKKKGCMYIRCSVLTETNVPGRYSRLTTATVFIMALSLTETWLLRCETRLNA